MEKGKHRKIQEKKLKFSYLIVILVIILLCMIKYIYSVCASSLENPTQVEPYNINELYLDTNESIENMSYTEILDDSEIEALINDFMIENSLNEENFSFFYYNIDTNKQYFFNEYKYFTAASTVKLPVAMLYYDKINNGSISASDTLLYKSNCYEAGNGTTNYYYSAGDYIPINFLLKQSIVNSDNTAINILMSNIGTIECRKQINKYTNEAVSDDFYNSNLTYAKYSFDILNYLYTNIDNYSELIEYLKISSEGQYLKKYITDYDVAHKYGSYNEYVHDYGIVFGENTYLIGVFTKNVPDAAELIANISLEVLNYTLK